MKNYSIKNLIIECFDKKVEEQNTRDIGKFLQFVAESYARRWLKEECGIESEGADNDENGNETTWDILTRNSKRAQVKYRGGKQGKSNRPKLFLETTRRNSKKNYGAKSKSGHVAYGSDEFDVALFVIPGDNFDFLNTDGLEMIAIPIHELIDPKHPEILLRNVPAAIMDKYQGKAKKIIIEIENAKSVCNW